MKRLILLFTFFYGIWGILTLGGKNKRPVSFLPSVNNRLGEQEVQKLGNSGGPLHQGLQLPGEHPPAKTKEVQ